MARQWCSRADRFLPTQTPPTVHVCQSLYTVCSCRWYTCLCFDYHHSTTTTTYGGTTYDHHHYILYIQLPLPPHTTLYATTTTQWKLHECKWSICTSGSKINTTSTSCSRWWPPCANRVFVPADGRKTPPAQVAAGGDTVCKESICASWWNENTTSTSCSRWWPPTVQVEY